jgi:molybdate transport system ATP-binding protein
MDQPFIGLDRDTRNHLHEVINQLTAQNILIILTTSAFEIPGCITKVLTLEDGELRSIENKKTFVEKSSFQKTAPVIFDINKDQLKKLVPGSLNEDFKYAIRMKNVNVRYGEKTILKNINWEVKKGERWLLCGSNGAGKSTLLSLVTADNPQAYANEIYLFDRRRGTGESIWDIKKKIGYLSPELHLFFDQASTCFETVSSGLFDTIGLFRKLSDDNIQQVYDWIEFTGLTKLCDKRLYQLSTGEQRMVLLARAFVKNPPMLILDEPCQGIDHERESMVLQLINEVCLAGNKTLVFVTHYHNDKPGCIDRFLNLDEGQISGSGLF